MNVERFWKTCYRPLRSDCHQQTQGQSLLYNNAVRTNASLRLIGSLPYTWLRDLGKAAACFGLISAAGCQLGMHSTNGRAAGLGSAAKSLLKPTTDDGSHSELNSPTAPPTSKTNESNGVRIRGQSPDNWGGTTVIGPNSAASPMPATIAGSRNYNATGSTTFGSTNRTATPGPATTSTSPRANLPWQATNPISPYAPLTANPYAPVTAANNSQSTGPQTGIPASLISTTTQSNNIPQSNFPNSPASGPATYSTFQPPAYQPPPNYQPQSTYQPTPTYQPPINYQPPPSGQTAPSAVLPDPYAGSAPNASPYAASPPVGYGAPGTYQAPGQDSYGSTIAPGAMGIPQTAESTLAPGAFPTMDPSAEFTSPTYKERVAPIDVYVQEARTGRVMLGGSVNSNLGLSGQLTIDERNFDYRSIPRSWDDVASGRAFRGGGQNLRVELMPGTLVQRYTVNWTERNLFGYLPYSLSIGGFFFTRQYQDWTEQRLGGRVALGYEITKDLSLSGELRPEDVKIFSPRVTGVNQLDRVLGSNDLYTARARLAHDTRDSPFMSTQGHLLELIYDQVFGEFNFPRVAVNYNRYFLIRERPDQTGRQTLASTWKFGYSGADTPIFENYFAGGYNTLRGFRFRGASPVVNTVQVGGRFMFLGSLEYVFPLTADEMLRGVAFVDYGTVEQDVTLKSSDFRVAPGFGLRIAVPALGPAPLAFDFAVPVNKADGDQTQIFSFFMGLTR